jgi:hypothetical protein
MKSGSKLCPFCGARYTFEDHELVDFRESEDRPLCLGCDRLVAILNDSAKRKAEMKPAEAQEPADLSPSAILARLLANRRRAAEPESFDPRMAAAGGERD